MAAAIPSIAGAVAGKAITGKGSKKAGKIAGGIVPKKISTGNSTYDTAKGTLNLDPTIRAGQDSFLSAISGMRNPINAAYDTNDAGLAGLSDRSAGLRADFEGNQSAYRDAQLNPLREKIAGRKGELDRNLERTKVRGSFGEQARNTLSLASGRALSDQEAVVENNRINALGDFLGMDADLLKQGLSSETGRISLLASLEDSLRSVSTERFNQEMQALGLPAQFIQGNIAGASIRSNAAGLDAQAGIKLAGTVIEGAGSLFPDSQDLSAGADSYN